MQTGVPASHRHPRFTSLPRMNRNGVATSSSPFQGHSQGDEDIATPKAFSPPASGPAQWLNPRSDSGNGCPLVSGANGSAINPITYTAHMVTPAYRSGSGMSL